MISLSVAIQHHPNRAALIPALVEALDGAAVVTDPDPTGPRSAWRTYRLALERTPSTATHRLIVQDDVEVCRNFRAAAERACAAHPDDLIAFFHSTQPAENLHWIRIAMHDREPWVALNVQRFIPVVALCWPRELAECIVEWFDEQGFPPAFTADDEIVGRFARACEVRCYATCPSLIEHTDVPSVGRRDQPAHRGRRAAYYIGDADPLEIDWG